MNKFPIVMKLWAGTESYDFDYISRSVPSLLASDLPEGAEILLFDDSSTDRRLQPFLKKIEAHDDRVRVITNETNKGPNRGQADAFDLVEAEYPDAPFFINVDDDVVYHRRWLVRLLEARDTLRAFGMNGIYTALNMPFRTPHARVHTGARTYLLKWKQPALNWLIPREVYEQTGPFSDDGIAYDTVYSHWLRLNRYPIICLKPSFVQNIGTFGAYSRDDTTTAHDFAGEQNGYSLPARLARGALRRIAASCKRSRLRISRDFDLVAPIRWGSEWVHEGLSREKRSVAVFLVDDAVRVGWKPDEIVKRAMEVKNHQARSSVAVRTVRRTVRGVPHVIECDWTFRPNLREYRRLAHLYPAVEPRRLFASLLRELLPLHRAGVVHNKIRQDNVYASAGGKDFHLAWYGTESPPRKKLVADREWSIATFGAAVDRRASSKIRERFATSYLETIAPEVIDGGEASLRSDVFATGAVVLLALSAELETLDQLEKLRQEWSTGRIQVPENAPLGDLLPVLARCVATDPSQRFESAVELQNCSTVLEICEKLSFPLEREEPPRPQGYLSLRGVDGSGESPDEET